MRKIQKMYKSTLLKKCNLKIKRVTYKSSVTSAMLYGSEAWCLIQNEADILPSNKGEMVIGIFDAKLVDKNMSKDLRQMVNLADTIDQVVNSLRARWYGQVENG